MKSGKMVLTDAAHKVAGHYPGWKVGARCVCVSAGWQNLGGSIFSHCCCVAFIFNLAWRCFSGFCIVYRVQGVLSL
jgi:hypothetical protein